MFKKLVLALTILFLFATVSFAAPGPEKSKKGHKPTVTKVVHKHHGNVVHQGRKHRHHKHGQWTPKHRYHGHQAIQHRHGKGMHFAHQQFGPRPQMDRRGPPMGPQFDRQGPGLRGPQPHKSPRPE